MDYFEALEKADSEERQGNREWKLYMRCLEHGLFAEAGLHYNESQDRHANAKAYREQATTLRYSCRLGSESNNQQRSDDGSMIASVLGGIAIGILIPFVIVAALIA